MDIFESENEKNEDEKIKMNKIITQKTMIKIILKMNKKKAKKMKIKMELIQIMILIIMKQMNS